MMSGDFARILRRLNPKLKIACGDRKDRLAGLYTVERGECVPICGVDKNYVSAYTVFDNGGHVIHSGYRRVVWILLGHGYTTRRLVQSIWPGFFDSRACDRDRWSGGTYGDSIGNLMAKYANEAPKGLVRDPDTKEIVEGSLLTKDHVIDLSQKIQAADSDEQKQAREEEKWFLETWKKNGGGKADKPRS
jgi:hypothetical protein